MENQKIKRKEGQRKGNEREKVYKRIYRELF